jgi:hypothetical protein
MVGNNETIFLVEILVVEFSIAPSVILHRYSSITTSFPRTNSDGQKHWLYIHQEEIT